MVVFCILINFQIDNVLYNALSAIIHNVFPIFMVVIALSTVNQSV